MWEENLGTQAGVHLIEGVCLIWGQLTVIQVSLYIMGIISGTSIVWLFFYCFLTELNLEIVTLALHPLWLY